MEKFILNSKEEVISYLKDFVGPGKILGLIGDLGFGKTTLVNELFKEFGFELSHSPTFSLINRYELGNGLKVFHVDLYRLKSIEEIDSSGFWDLFADQESLVIVEWADRIDNDLWPLNFIKCMISIKVSENKKRSYHINI